MRACLALYRAEHNNYRTNISNKVLYNKANIPRIDNFIIKLTKDYYANAIKINNVLIEDIVRGLIGQVTDRQKTQGLLPPESFLTLVTRLRGLHTK